MLKLATVKRQALLMQKAVFGDGCFWCTEAVFQRIRGVEKVTSGYAGGEMENPSYGEVSSGETGHAEAIEIEFDPKEISYKDLVYIFFRTHDPTDTDGQGADHGSQYRSVIFYMNEAQRKVAEAELKKAQKEFDDPVVTQIKPLATFYVAEEYHQNYYEENPSAGYCRLVIDPKIHKLQKQLGKFLKD